MNINKILVATDFSNAANNALQYATNLAAQLGAQVDIVHAFTLPILTARGRPVLPNPEVADSSQQMAEEQMEKTKQLVAGDSSISFNSKVIHIYWEAELAEAIHSQHTDLIIVGTTGVSGWKKIFMGSNAARIIQGSPVPVLAIPENAKFSPPRKMGMAYDGLQIREIEKLGIIKSFREKFNAGIQIFQIVDGDQTESPFLSELLNYLPGAEPNHVYDTVIESGILKSIEQNQLDMMIMIPRKHGFFYNLVNGSITKRVAYEISVPLLAIPE